MGNKNIINAYYYKGKNVDRILELLRSEEWVNIRDFGSVLQKVQAKVRELNPMQFLILLRDGHHVELKLLSHEETKREANRKEIEVLRRTIRRDMPQITVGDYRRTPGQTLPTTRRADPVCRDKNDRGQTAKNTDINT